MNDFDLIIFDCDGVLVDSERIANEVFADVLNRELGFSLSLEDMFEHFVGRSSAQCMQIIENMLGSKPPSSLETMYKTEINQALEKSVTAVNGIEKTLRDISIPYCVASSGSYEKMKTTLGKTNLITFFKDVLYSTSDVNRGKPFPDIYLYAAQRMGFSEPSRCLVIEDSSIGVQGAVAAGMTVFGYAELTASSTLLSSGAHHTFKHMGNLANEILNYQSASVKR